MRIIKFRVWDIKFRGKKKFYYPDENGEIYVRGIKMTLQDLLTQGTHCNDRFVFQQFTGLTDANGKKIYEGDIVKFEKYIFQILWSEEDAAFISINKTNMSGAFLNPRYLLNFEVIGNIYETPELIP